MGISLKVNFIARLEFELDYYDITFQHVSHYAVETIAEILIEVYLFMGSITKTWGRN